jgi:hypothetical protein
MTPSVATRGAPENPAGAARRAGCTASIVPSSPMYTAPALTTGWSSSYVTTVPVRTSVTD